jgi:drug/metabolite transporter (DMT)-like permease
VLTVVAVLGCLLLAGGALLVLDGYHQDDGGRTVIGILLGLAGLVCFRILYWTRRIRLMTRAGLAFHVDEDRHHTVDRDHPDGG